MSQKYKNFSKGRSTLELGSLPPGVKRVGYLRKLKKMKKRFFVLHTESNYGIARLEYYSSEKKWKFGCEPRRCIDLKTCLNISRKLHSKQKNIIAFYTQCDCFAIVADSAQELEDWLKDILEVYKSCVDGDNSKNRLVYDHLWQVIIDKHDLEYDKFLAGPHRVALTPKSLFLIKMNPLGENDYLEFPLMSIRRCGHSKDHFFIELGRSAVTGAGEIYMATEATVVAQNMHETVLSAMKSSKIREDPIPRPRSASSSENPISVNRPIGVVAPQTFSSSRERCDSLPTRPQTIVGDNSYNFSSFSSPYTSIGSLSKDGCSRPHSMYEWPSLNSPSPNIFSPESLSGGSAENVNSTRSLSSDQYFFLSCGNTSSGGHAVEAKDDYLKMSPNSEEKSSPFNYTPMKKSTNTPSEYVDMKATHNSGQNYIPMAHGGASDDEPIIMQAGYIDMSPSSSLPNNSEFNERLKGFDTPNDKERLKSYELEKVLSLLQVEDISKNSTDSIKNKSSVIIEDFSSKSQSFSISSHQTIENVVKIPERTYSKNETNQYNVKSMDARNPVLQTQEVSKLEDVFSSVWESSASSKHYNTDLYFHKSDVKTDEQKDSDVNRNPSSDNICDNNSVNCLRIEVAAQTGDYVNINLEKNFMQPSSGSIKHKSLLSFYPSDPNYSNIQFGKPICPLPNPKLATSDNTFSTCIKSDGNFLPTCKCEDYRTQNVLKPPLAQLYSSPDTTKMAPVFRNIPNTLPAFRKQMSAPAGPLSLRPELPSPGRKSSCPVTVSASMAPARPSAHLRVSPEHSSVSSVSSASDEISSAHSSPKILSQNVDDSQYENVVIVQSSEKDLIYASLDLAPSKKETPTIVVKPDIEEPLMYAEIDFTKSEGLKNTSGSLREGRL